MDIFRSLIAQGFKNIIVLLGHGGSENTQAVNDAAMNFQRLQPDLEGICILVVPFWELSPAYMESFGEGDYHAGKYETSMMLYWHPELVQMDHAAVDSKELLDLMRSDPDAYAARIKAIDSEFVKPRLVQNPAIEVGVMGDPFTANAELGKTIAEESSTGLAALVEKLQRRLKDG
jgi:creatinine amidohydrolase